MWWSLLEAVVCWYNKVKDTGSRDCTLTGDGTLGSPLPACLPAHPPAICLPPSLPLSFLCPLPHSPLPALLHVTYNPASPRLCMPLTGIWIGKGWV